jgi:hypothetical protein
MDRLPILGIGAGLEVPFNAVLESSRRQIGAADDRCTLAVACAEDPGLWMKAAAARLEYKALDVSFEIHQPAKGCRFGHVEIVAHHQPQFAAACKQILQIGLNQRDAAFERKRHRQINVFGVIDLALEVFDQRIAHPGDERVSRSHRPSFGRDRRTNPEAEVPVNGRGGQRGL